MQLACHSFGEPKQSCDVRNGSEADLSRECPEWADCGHCRFGELPYPRHMEAGPPRCVGLAGDGDEIAAIENVEDVFGVTLDDQDAPLWLTAGDVFASLLKALPPDAAADPTTWRRFAEALAAETGIDPCLITNNSPLLLPDKGTWGGIKEGCLFVAVLWMALLVAAIVF